MGGVVRRRVLVADDDVLLRWALASRLEELGYEVVESGSVAETLDREGDVDLVLLDVRLPDGDGLTAAREILRRNPTRPLLLMTAFSTPEILTEASRAGARCCIDKPLDVNVTARLVHDSLTG